MSTSMEDLEYRETIRGSIIDTLVRVCKTDVGAKAMLAVGDVNTTLVAIASMGDASGFDRAINKYALALSETFGKAAFEEIIGSLLVRTYMIAGINLDDLQMLISDYTSFLPVGQVRGALNKEIGENYYLQFVMLNEMLILDNANDRK